MLQISVTPTDMTEKAHPDFVGRSVDFDAGLP
jgi:hypothetical protein